MTAAAANIVPDSYPLENGAPIVLLPADPYRVHLPGVSNNATGRAVELDDHLAAGGMPLSWRALCGARGHVFVYALMFAHRGICTDCEFALREAAA